METATGRELLGAPMHRSPCPFRWRCSSEPSISSGCHPERSGPRWPSVSWFMGRYSTRCFGWASTWCGR